MARPCQALRPSRAGALAQLVARSGVALDGERALPSCCLTILAPEHDGKQHGTDRHGGVSDVERPEAHGADTDVDEVHNALIAADTIDEVARRTAPGQAERERLQAITAALPRQTPQDDEREKRERAEDVAVVLLAEGHAERRALVVHQGEA